MFRAELDYKGEKLVTGMLVKSPDVYRFFRKYFSSNWIPIQTCNSFALNSQVDVLASEVETSHFQGLFYPFFYGTLMTLAGIACFGCVYEMFRTKALSFLLKPHLGNELWDPYESHKAIMD